MNARFVFAMLGTAALVLSAPTHTLAGVRVRAPQVPEQADTSAPDEQVKGATAPIEEQPSAADSSTADAQAKAAAAAVEVAPSNAATRVIDWVATSHDNGSLPYIVIDKQAAVLFLFNAEGKVLGNAPVLIGVATGDESSPGVGSKVLARIGPAERTTPAGRYLAKYGFAAGGERVLWVDYADSVALHAVITTNKKERRLQRLRSPTVDDNRITFGCINVPTIFYQRRIRPLFGKQGGIVYILPDTKPLEEVFPRLLTQPVLARAAK